MECLDTIDKWQWFAWRTFTTKVIYGLTKKVRTNCCKGVCIAFCYVFAAIAIFTIILTIMGHITRS